MATTAGAQLLPLMALSLLLILLLGPGGAAAQQQTCAAQLSGLAPCARYSVPPAPGQAPPAPGAECCSALGAVTRDCACATLDIMNSLPAKCGLPRVSCPLITIAVCGESAKDPSARRRR
ncbi:hypothetical protein ACP70R_044523 [Stipagrostis hirtigluma subsp. patula]